MVMDAEEVDIRQSGGVGNHGGGNGGTGKTPKPGLPGSNNTGGR